MGAISSTNRPSLVAARRPPSAVTQGPGRIAVLAPGLVTPPHPVAQGVSKASAWTPVIPATGARRRMRSQSGCPGG